ncbi:MAG: FAD-dependent oxidoreductase [Candidatus Nanopelagicales bacterium]
MRDVVIVGGGAAGVNAAVIAASSGCRVALVDSGPEPGGQYYRGGPTGRFAEMCDRLAALEVSGRVELLFDHYAYALESTNDGFRVRVRGDDRHRGDIQVLDAHAVVVATGAFDRQLPFPGWALPGVMSGGAAQALVKGSGVLPGQRIAIAGTGPFLLAVAATVLDAGGNVAAVIEANDPISIARRVRSTLPVISKSGELAGYLATLARHRVPYLRRHRVTRAHGADHLESLTLSKVDADWCALPGTEREIEIDALAIGYGFTAQTDVLGAARFARGADGGIAVAVDDRQETSVRGLFAAGETTGVGGVDLAAYEGLLAGAAAAEHCGMAPALTARAETQARRRVGDLRRFADTLHATFPVREGWRDDVDNATLVCRCEEVSAQQVRDAVRMGATDARSVKLITRAGMGWCQGRVCGPIVDGLCGFDDLASLVGAATRPVAAPVPLGALAGQQVEG